MLIGAQTRSHQTILLPKIPRSLHDPHIHSEMKYYVCAPHFILIEIDEQKCEIKSQKQFESITVKQRDEKPSNFQIKIFLLNVNLLLFILSINELCSFILMLRLIIVHCAEFIQMREIFSPVFILSNERNSSSLSARLQPRNPFN